MAKKVLINSRTSGKHKIEFIDGREHIVTTMMPIRGDTSMNDKFYPDLEVSNSYEQLNLLPAPHKHPVVNGIKVPAYHPVANNKHNIGGFLRNPVKRGKNVYVDFLLDVQVANGTAAGKETIRRIKAGEKIGVSTGLTVSRVDNQAGKDDFGKDYSAVLGGYKFDHVAILLDEEAAGDHAGTELVLNEEGEKIEVATLDDQLITNEITPVETVALVAAQASAFAPQDGHCWLGGISLDDKTAVFNTIAPDGATRQIEKLFTFDAERNVTFQAKKADNKESFNNNQDEVCEMDKLAIVLAIIGNSANEYQLSDKDALMALSDKEIASIIATNSVDEKGARKILANSGHDFEGYENYIANKEKFKAFLANEETKLQTLRDSIVANSEFTVEMLKGKDEAELTALEKLTKPAKQSGRAAQGNSTHHNNSASSRASAGEVDYS